LLDAKILVIERKAGVANLDFDCSAGRTKNKKARHKAGPKVRCGVAEIVGGRGPSYPLPFSSVTTSA
jgi:hypothetical protein